MRQSFDVLSLQNVDDARRAADVEQQFEAIAAYLAKST
jgi:hypothetical protein